MNNDVELLLILHVLRPKGLYRGLCLGHTLPVMAVHTFLCIYFSLDVTSNTL
jgi:hypothetical protein